VHHLRNDVCMLEGLLPRQPLAPPRSAGIEASRREASGRSAGVTCFPTS
jgi:hypothetical protein